MHDESAAFSLPRWRITRWLAAAGRDVPGDIRIALISSLYGTLPIFAGGVINTVLISTVIAVRIPGPLFLTWLAIEIVLGAVRLGVLLHAYRAARVGRPTPTDIYMLLAVAWAASVGYGVLISMLSGDWVVATLACLSAAAMVGGICFRNFAAPRLVGVMILFSLGPACIGAALSGEWVLAVVLFQIPFYLYSMSMASYRLNAMLVTTMEAERENRRQARHDALTGLPNRIALQAAVDQRLADLGGDRDLALIYLDLDGFKSVNDTHGHAAGDQLLRLVSSRLQRTVRPDDFIARIGGDEFVLLLADLDRRQLLGMGTRIIERLGMPFRLDTGEEITIGASAGMAMAPQHGHDLATLLAAADTALYDSKMRGKFRCSIAV